MPSANKLNWGRKYTITSKEIGSKDYGVELNPIDFAKNCGSLRGKKDYTCFKPAELSSVLETAFAVKGPVVIEVVVDPAAMPDPPDKLKA